MKIIFLAILSFCVCLVEVKAQEKVDVDLIEACGGDHGPSCDIIRNLGEAGHTPLKIFRQDPSGTSWEITLFFGFSRTEYGNTNVRLKTSQLNVLIRDFEFEERTSSAYYNFTEWQKLQDYFRWIDEPTNTIVLSFAKKNNSFQFTIFHPKFLKSPGQYKQVEGEVNGVEVNQFMYLDEPNLPLNRFENTYMQLDFQVGFARKLVLYSHNKSTISLTVSGDVGITMGKNLTEYYDGAALKTIRDKTRLEGMNASFGTRVEYEYGRVGLFLEQKNTYSNLEHPFLDGTASYKMSYAQFTFGASFDLKRKPKPRPGL